MHVTNQTSDQHPVKVCLYKTDDGVCWIPVGAGVFTVQANENHEWDPVPGEGLDAYHMKVFHPQFLDAFLCGLNPAPVDGNFAVQGGGGTYEGTYTVTQV
jgi:hypothetical protein